MRLFTSPTTPFGRKVQVALIESGLADRVTIDVVGGTPLDPGTMPLDRNPLGKIPALVREDGGALYDSRVICRYLDQVSDGKLYPVGPALWDTLVLEATADGMLEAAVLMVYEARLRPEELRFAPWVDGQWGKVSRALDAIEARWTAHLAGPVDMGHLALACALSYLDFRHGARNWREGRPALTAWEAVMAQRPSMVETKPPAA
jgi:glutathione S-transferase